MALPESPSIIEEYSQTFTSLTAGKRELIQWGANAVMLNRYIVDSAGDTGDSDPTLILQSIDISRVTHGETEQECFAYCESALKKLIALQEEVFVLQKTAREKGISGGLLTIIGQAANQSPEDNGASVLRQLSDLVTGEEAKNDADDTVSSATRISLDESAANDTDRLDLDRMTTFQMIAHTLSDHWKALAMDAFVCAIAAGIAISLIN